jgi:aspartate carbamoyltransferase catalytic subunit
LTFKEGLFLSIFNFAREAKKEDFMTGRHLIEPRDFTLEELEEIFQLAEGILERPKDFLDVCKGKLLATLFYEPSTRTRFSFEAAMLRLGGSIIGFDDPNASSTSKGESLSDTIRTINAYADAIVMRHPREGSSKLASESSVIPVINAGDGGHQHPTQTLTDLLTIRQEKGRLKNLTIGVCGDLKFGRTIHSLIRAMDRYDGIRFIFISPEELELPTYVKEEIEHSEYVETQDLESVMGDLDILYMSRVQRERFVSEEEYLRLKDTYILNPEKMELAKADAMILHPLPRVNEISTEVDKDPRAKYFDQAHYGMIVRMALLMTLLGVKEND